MSTRIRSASRGEAPRRQRRHAAAARHAGRPTSRRRSARSCASTTADAGLPPRVGRGRRAPRAVLVPRRRPAPAARGPRRPGPRSRPGPSASTLHPGPADRDGRRRPTRSTRSAPSSRGGGSQPTDGHAALHRRRGRRARVRRRSPIVRAHGPAARRGPRRRPDRRLHRDRPRPRLRPPDPHAVARSPRSTPRRPTSRAATGSPSRRSSRRSSGRPARARRGARPARTARPAPRDGAGARLAAPIETSLGRDEYIHAVEVAKDAIASGEAIQVVLARRQSFELPRDPATGQPLDGIGLYRALRRVNPSPYLFFVRTPDVRGRRRQPGAARSRSRATS